VYLETGNHDVGGWDSTPPPQGTARRNWWRFFGWNWLEDPPAVTPCHTQNYSFNYGDVHYIGMDSYINYDNFMYNVFGDQSFTDPQMQWLDDDLQQYASSETFVLFYHYDFSDQIDLAQLDVDMALWGHIHSNSGDINSHPYNLATKAICDGNRAYRVIHVNDFQLQPTETVYAGASGDELQTTFIPDNNGSEDSVYCLVENEHNLSFASAQLKFKMPGDAADYQVYNGILTQVDSLNDFSICYVSFDIPADGSTSVSVVANFNSVSGENEFEFDKDSFYNTPNPFENNTTISFDFSQNATSRLDEFSGVTLEIYNLKGEKIKSFSREAFNFLNHSISVVWDGKDEEKKPVSAGVYFYLWKVGDKSVACRKCLLLK